MVIHRKVWLRNATLGKTSFLILPRKFKHAKKLFFEANITKTSIKWRSVDIE